MKKPWLLIIAGIVLIILIGLWLYLFFGGDEARDNLYNTFGFTGDELPLGLDDLFDNDIATTTTPYLRRISERQVIGYTPFEASSTTNPYVYLAEAGTGHIYRVDAISGEEERLSNITIPTAARAVFSESGQYAAVVPSDGGVVTILTLPVGTSTVTATNLDIKVVDMSFTFEDVLVYTVQENQTTVGKTYDPVTKKTVINFTIPFREATVLFGNTMTGPHYAYPKPAEELEGYVYSIENGNFRRLPISGFGLSVSVGGDSIFFARIENNQQKNYVYNTVANTVTNLNAKVFPDKCASFFEDFVCGETAQKESFSMWLRGEYNTSDSLWYLESESGFFVFIEDVSNTIGQSLDITKPVAGLQSLYFINKVSDQLWVYDRDFTTPLTDN